MRINNDDFNKASEELLLQLAKELQDAGVIRFSGPINKKGMLERASAWLEATLGKVKSSICLHPKVIAYLEEPGPQRKAEIAAVVFDCLSGGNLNLPIPLGTLSVLIVNDRLESLCS